MPALTFHAAYIYVQGLVKHFVAPQLKLNLKRESRYDENVAKQWRCHNKPTRYFKKKYDTFKGIERAVKQNDISPAPKFPPSTNSRKQLAVSFKSSLMELDDPWRWWCSVKCTKILLMSMNIDFFIGVETIHYHELISDATQNRPKIPSFASPEQANRVQHANAWPMTKEHT